MKQFWNVHMKHKVMTVLGLTCIVLGLLAFFTPLTPGAWLFLIGLELLGFRLIVSKDHRHSMWERLKSVKIRRKKEEEGGVVKNIPENEEEKAKKSLE